MALVVDFHVHVFPEKVTRWVPDRIRKSARGWYRPISTSLHRAQTILRYFPGPARHRLDQISGIVPLPGLLLESSLNDLKDAMGESNIDFALTIAHPPYIPNEFILEIATENKSLIPVVNIPSGTTKPGNVLKKFVEKGAKLLKIHPPADGEGADSPRYRALLKVADDLGLPVIIHTGCIQTHVLYKDPDQGKAQQFSPWFEKYPETKFILAHMNFHEPQIALDLMEEYPNVYVDTSWQPAEVIGEAARRVGAQRILFGSDWPIVGNNLSVGVHRIRDCVDIGLLNSEEVDLILGKNAVKLLGLESHAAH